MGTYEIALCLGVVAPLLMFVVLAFFGHRIGKPVSGWAAVGGVLVSLGCASYVLVGWLSSPDQAALSLTHGYEWVVLNIAGADMPIEFKVKLDGLTVMMYFMVTLVSTCIFVFSIGYMAGHSDEVDGQCKFHRFFCYLSLFEFSMLGLLISSSIFFLFIFWELVGLCSYLLIGFYFDKKFASNAAMKAFITNRVGDFGFLLGLMLVFVFLKTFDLDQAAETFRAQYADGSGIFDASISILGWQVSGMGLATLMGIGLFCGAMGKSAQFPLHVWLPDAMAGPTPVSALIHAATMVAAGVYLVARIFRLLTPDAQFFIAVIGCITLTITALIAIVQVDIKKVLAYSTLSQLGYMIFGMGVGAWPAALFHLITHAFFKAMMFLGSGQVIEGCHHVQDMRRMGGLRKKMPVTCWTFFIGVLAIAGFGIPGTHYGLGGFFSKDEVLAVAYERSFNWENRFASHADDGGHGDDHAAESLDERKSRTGLMSGRVVLASGESDGAGHGSKEAGDSHAAGGSHHDDPVLAGIALQQRVIPKWMFWLPIIIAYVTPFYMMRCWWMTFMGKPRDEDVYHHAHESRLMYVPLIVLAVGTVFASYFMFRPVLGETAVIATSAPLVVAVDGAAAADAQPELLGLSHDKDRDPHRAMIGYVGFAWVVGMGLAILIYRQGLELAERIRRLPGVRFIHMCLMEKLFFDYVYDTVLVGGTKWVLAQIARAIDTYIIDGIANLLGRGTVRLAEFSGNIVDAGGVDGLVDAIAETTQGVSDVVRQPQTGRIRNYVLFGTTGAALVLAAIIAVVMS
ncbi:MAG: NADH-quinone oxidoreductase subunit L [Planctomycetes bacterium]|nr:NADH-quinone oxidoreductase subunit L [Planctomycetota bacterium]